MTTQVVSSLAHLRKQGEGGVYLDQQSSRSTGCSCFVCQPHAQLLELKAVEGSVQ